MSETPIEDMGNGHRCDCGCGMSGDCACLCHTDFTPADPEALRPCPICKGLGYLVTSFLVGPWRTRPCKRCNGTGTAQPVAPPEVAPPLLPPDVMTDLVAEALRLVDPSRPLCNCRQAYSSGDGRCDHGCSANQLRAKDEMARYILAKAQPPETP